MTTIRCNCSLGLKQFNNFYRNLHRKSLRGNQSFIYLIVLHLVQLLTVFSGDHSHRAEHAYVCMNYEKGRQNEMRELDKGHIKGCKFKMKSTNGINVS